MNRSFQDYYLERNYWAFENENEDEYDEGTLPNLVRVLVCLLVLDIAFLRSVLL